MKHLSIYFIFFVSIIFCSCGEPDYPPSPTNRKYSPPPNSGEALVATTPGQVYCPNIGKNCYLFMDPGDYPVYARQILDNFYADYASDSLGSFFNKNDWRQLFPSWSTIDEIAVQKIISKEYETKVLSDGSFVIMKVPNGGLTEENVLFAFAK